MYTNPSLIWGWLSSWFVINIMLKLGYRRSFCTSPASNYWWQLLCLAFKSKLLISNKTTAAIATTTSRRNLCRINSTCLICFNIYNINCFFLISGRKDWINRLSKRWMLDHSVYCTRLSTLMVPSAVMPINITTCSYYSNDFPT